MAEQPDAAMALPAAERAMPVILGGSRAARAYNRPDLAGRLETTRLRLANPSIRVLVIGEFKQGKSTLVNALVGGDVCPVDDDVATAVPTVVRFGEERGAWKIHEPADGEEPPRDPIAFDELPVYASELGNPRNQRRLRAVEIAMPSEILNGGLELVDTPGVGGLGSVHGAITMAALPMADALVFVTDASQELSAPEMDFLTRARELCPNVIGVMPKIDFYPEWERIRDIDLGRLRSAGMRIGLTPVASNIHRLALERGDADLEVESGFPSLVEYLRDTVVSEAEELAVRAAAHDVLWVAAQLEQTFRSERTVLAAPEEAARVLKELEATQERVGRLRTDAAGWVLTLNDSIGDLNSDADHDLRSRFRLVLREAETSIEETDPADTWSEFEPWVYRKVAWEMSESYRVLALRIREVVDRVADHFRELLGEADPFAGIEIPELTVDGFDVDAGAQFRGEGVGEQGLTWLRGAYGGFAMFGMVGSMAGLAALNPVILPISLLLGRKAVRDERQRKLKMRQQEAKQAVRRYLDEAQFTIGKDLRDALRRIQRELRDAFQARGEELQRSTEAALQAAQQATRGTVEEREQQLRHVDAELEKIEILRQHAAALAPGLAAARSASA